jgi:predicted glycoside hydrolase/deacetylase ChbG (UPF0249 family)
MTKLIVNADDFGFSRGVTDGILRSHKEGILTSTTLMTNMVDRDRAIDLAGQTPTLGVGIHLNLTQGKPLTDCSRIVGADGMFLRSLPKLFWRLRSQETRKEATQEMRAQVEYARRRGLTPTHVDSHKHVCHLPWLHDSVIEVCREMGIGWVRCAREVRVEGTGGLGLPYRVQVRFARTLAEKVKAAGLKTTDWFFGLGTTGRTDAAVWEKLAAKMPGGLGEVMVHPGFVQDVTPADTRLLKERVVEMEALCDQRVRAGLDRAGVRLVRYGNDANEAHR